MKKRHFLTTAAIACTGASAFAAPSKITPAVSGPTLLTATGNIGAGNRGRWTRGWTK